jgi:hypothetical protein
VNLEEKLTVFDERWCPRIVGELNGQHVKLVRILGGFVCHRHDEEELFLVAKGRFRMEFRDRSVPVEEGSSSSVRAASSTGPWPTRRRTWCSSSPPRRSTRATSGASGRSRSWTGSEIWRVYL